MPQLKKRQSKWFAIPDDPLQGEVEVAQLSKSEIQDIMTRGIDTRVISRAAETGGPPLPETHTKVDNGLIRREVAVAAVLNWKNFQDQSGATLACTPDNVRLFARDDEFMDHLAKFREALAAEVKAAEESDRKN